MASHLNEARCICSSSRTEYHRLRLFYVQVFLVRKISGKDAGTLYAMKVLKKATLKGNIMVVSYGLCIDLVMSRNPT